MKLKNKRLFLLSMLCTLGVGMLTLSIGGLNPKLTGSTETAALGKEETKGSKTISDDTDQSAEQSGAEQITAAPIETIPTVTSAPVPTKAALPTASPTPEPLKVYPLEAGGTPEMNALFQDYYLAKLACDTEKMKELLSDPKYCPSQNQLEKETAYVDDFGNLKIYVKKSYEADSYIVYVYHEVTYLNIKTPAPFIDKFYVITDIEGQLKIYSPEYQPEFETYYNDRDLDQDVKDLVEKTNKKSKKAIEKDEDLKIYLEKLQGWLKNKQ